MTLFKKLKFIIFILLITNINISISFSDDFFFEGEEIEILNNGELLKSNKGVKITSTNGMIITSKTFEYNKKNSELNLDGNVIINDKLNQTIIKTGKIKYIKSLEKILTYENTEIEIEEKIFVKSKNIVYLRNQNEISSNFKTFITDNLGNNFSSKDFLFDIEKKVLKAVHVNLIDIDGNITFFESFFGDISNNEFYGKDVEISFSNKSFGNRLNEPRLYGNTFSSNKNESKISKGIFTTCKKRDGCPPWVIKAKNVIHDKNKKRINYHNAWLQVYDKPILYFPKFFHPDPTVKRQSGFLIPQFNDSGNTGTSIQIPYYKVLAENKDMTITPIFFTDNSLLLQNEYRKVDKNYDHISDISFYTSALTNGEQDSKSHLFSNTKFKLNDFYFEDSELEINIEQVSNDSYLKKYKLNTPLIKNETLMHSFIKYDGYNDNSFLNINLETYEDLTKKESDRYEVILPNVRYSKNFSSDLDLLGDLGFNSSFYQKQFDTNKYTQSLNNSLEYYSPKKFEKNGLIKDFKLKLTNPNKRDKVSSDDKSETKNQLLSQLMYTLSYPLRKKNELSESFITPNLSYRFSPNLTRNISDDDRRLDITNINSFNRISDIDTVEGGHSITASMGYKKIDLNGNERLAIDIAQVISDTKNPDLPTKTSLNKKYSDVIGKVKFNASDILSFDYDFMLDDSLHKSNYNSIKTIFSINNLVTSFEYLEESEIIGKNHYFGNTTELKLNDQNKLSFKTRKNREIDMTEFYNLIYQYENDCLRAALEYNKSFYSDSDIRPEEELLFSLTVIPFSKFNSKNLK